MSVRPSISVVIPSYNGGNKIGVLLSALTRQTISANEIIVVSDGSTDNTVSVSKSFEKSLIGLHVIETPNRGRSIARNTGVKNSTGDIIIFYDDDMEPKENSIALHLQFHKQRIGLVCGLPLEIVSPQQSDILNYKATRASGWVDAYPNAMNKLDIEKLFFTTSNCSIPRDVFNQLHGFDERLTDAEDFDLAYRAIEYKLSVFFDKTNLAVHHERITGKSFIARTRQYQNAHDSLRALHPTRLYPVKPLKPNFMKRLFYAFFDFSFWIWVIDRTRLLQAMPQPWRYKIYDWIIYSQGVVNKLK